MIHCILGHGASGKTTVQSYLKKYIPAITTYTTRPIRHNESDGVHYHFINNYEFEQRLKDGFFIEHYYIEENKWYYGFSLTKIDFKNKDYSLVIDPQGFKTLSQKIDSDYLKCYYINLSESDRIVRMAKRKDKIEEIYRRIISDRKDFDGFENIADTILTSLDSKKNLKTILNHIKERAF